MLFVIRYRGEREEKVAFLRGMDALVLKESGHPAHIFNPGRAMRLCSADLSPQALMRARCPRSLVKNRRREAASPYHSELGAGRSTSYDEEVSPSFSSSFKIQHSKFKISYPFLNSP
jgi:hypothetical protein